MKGRGASTTTLALAFLILSGWERFGEKQASTATLPAAPTSTSTTTFPGAAASQRGFSTDRVVVQSPGPAGPSSFFKQVRFAAGDGYDRAVFEFDGFPWGAFYAEYPGAEQGLGDAGCSEPERTKGTDLVVSFHGTGTTPLPDGKGPQSYRGADRIRPGTTTEIREAVFFCEFEATVEWVFVLADRRPFRVATLPDPPRIVIDVERQR